MQQPSPSPRLVITALGLACSEPPSVSPAATPPSVSPAASSTTRRAGRSYGTCPTRPSTATYRPEYPLNEQTTWAVGYYTAYGK